MKTIKPLLTAYFDHLHAIYASGRATDERSYYGALAELYDGVGRELNPPVIAVPDVTDAGVGHPDLLLNVAIKGTAVEVR